MLSIYENQLKYTKTTHISLIFTSFDCCLHQNNVQSQFMKYFLVFPQIEVILLYYKFPICMYSRLNEGPFALSGTENMNPGHVTIHVLYYYYQPKGDL
jgi:hypothetical protein